MCHSECRDTVADLYGFLAYFMESAPKQNGRMALVPPSITIVPSVPYRMKRIGMPPPRDSVSARTWRHEPQGVMGCAV